MVQGTVVNRLPDVLDGSLRVGGRDDLVQSTHISQIIMQIRGQEETEQRGQTNACEGHDDDNDEKSRRRQNILLLVWWNQIQLTTKVKMLTPLVCIIFLIFNKFLFIYSNAKK